MQVGGENVLAEILGAAQGLDLAVAHPRHAATALGAMVDRLMYIWFVQGEDLDEKLVLETLARLWIQGLGLRRRIPGRRQWRRRRSQPGLPEV